MKDEIRLIEIKVFNCHNETEAEMIFKKEIDKKSTKQRVKDFKRNYYNRYGKKILFTYEEK